MTSITLSPTPSQGNSYHTDSLSVCHAIQYSELYYILYDLIIPYSILSEIIITIKKVLEYWFDKQYYLNTLNIKGALMVSDRMVVGFTTTNAISAYHH